MKTLVESIFGRDNITSDLPLSIEVIHEEVLNALKKYNLEDVDWVKWFYKGYIPQRPGIIDGKNDIPNGFFNITVFTPNKYVYRSSKKKDEEVYIGINICIGTGDDEDHEDENKFYITRVDVEWIESDNQGLFPHSSVLWDRSGWKRYSSLKTNEINEKTINTIIKYIVGLVDKTLKMMDKDRQEIYDIFRGHTLEGGDPLLYGRKDCYWYIEKIKKELR